MEFFHNFCLVLTFLSHYIIAMSKPWSPDIKKSDPPVYMAILKALEADIVSGALPAGERLPTHRELADNLGLAVGTVTKAYREAERRGLIEGDGRRGTFVGRLPGQPETFLHMLPEAPGVIDLSPYYPPSVTDPDLRHALGELASRDIGYLIHYSGPRGYARHRSAGTKWISALGMQVTDDDVVITAGAQHAILTTLMAAADRGDVVAAADHTYPGIKWVCGLLGLKLVGVESDEGGMLPDSFESCCTRHRVRFLYCIPTLHNPTNATLTEERRKALAEVAEKHDVRIIEDEINRRLVLDPPPLISSLVPERSFLIASLAKVVAGGLRISYLVPPTRFRERLYKAILGTTLMVSPLLAELATMWIENGTAERSVAQKRTEAEKRNGIVLRVLKDFDFNHAPTSYFVWLKLSRDRNPEEFVAQTRRRGVMVAPSDIFAVEADKAEKAVRICLGGNNDIETLERGLRTIAAVMHGGKGPDSSVF